MECFLRQRLKPDRTIIFDDLERSSLWANQKSELLGAINHYVEHRGFRVIVICHDERIADQLAELKEKHLAILLWSNHKFMRLLKRF